MSSPGLSGETPRAADLFEGLWRQLRDCHQNALQGLEAKVSKLKKERCLDAQRLEVFYNRTQRLKEENKSLQNAITLLEERLRAGECDRCAILGEDLKQNQDQNLRLVTKLKNERNSLEDENRKLHTELQKLKMSHSELQRASSPEQEDGIIPDSPVLPSSLPVVNRLKKDRNPDRMKHVRYAEVPLLPSNNSLFKELNREPVDASRNPGRTEVLVPNTCELDTSQISHELNVKAEEAVAETCAFELLNKPHMKSEMAADKQSSSRSPRKYGISLRPCHSSSSSALIHSPDSTTERSPSLLPRVKRFSEGASITKTKRKKEESELELQEEDKQENQSGVGKRIQPEPIKQRSLSISSQSFKEPLGSKDRCPRLQSAQNGISNQKPACLSPAFKKPNVRGEARRGRPLRELSASCDQHGGEDDEMKHNVEPMWSIDPALNLSTYDSEWRSDEQKDKQQCHGDLADTDCTWVSHSLLQCQGENSPERRGSVSGLGEKANDSLGMMFDTTSYGEYKSFSSSGLGQSQPCEEDEEVEEEEDEKDPHENTSSQRKGHKAQHPTFAHVAVVRKKDERRKLKGTTCKECEVYYAHLPEEEKQKKLSACSRHRFLYIPPCTPENFWDVGFPSTQTCIERGYIKEEKNPQVRSRRRQPFNAFFSPKPNQQEH